MIQVWMINLFFIVGIASCLLYIGVSCVALKIRNKKFDNFKFADDIIKIYRTPVKIITPKTGGND